MFIIFTLTIHFRLLLSNCFGFANNYLSIAWYWSTSSIAYFCQQTNKIPILAPQFCILIQYFKSCSFVLNIYFHSRAFCKFCVDVMSTWFSTFILVIHSWSNFSALSLGCFQYTKLKNTLWHLLFGIIIYIVPFCVIYYIYHISYIIFCLIWIQTPCFVISLN